MNERFELNREQYKKIDSVFPDLHVLKQNLQGVIHPEYLALIEKIQKNLHDAFAPIIAAEEKDFDSNNEKLLQIQEQHGFFSVWSVSDVRAEQMNELMPFKIGTIVYDSWGPQQKKKVNKHLTWIEAWKLADELIQLSGDEHHMFVEVFQQDPSNSNVVHMSTGS